MLRPRLRVFYNIRFRVEFVVKIQAECYALYMCHVSMIQRLQFTPSADRAAETQFLVQSMLDASFTIFYDDDSLVFSLWIPSYVSEDHSSCYTR